MAGQKVLLVDDEQEILNSLKRTLHGEPYKILTAKSAEKALEIINGEKIDLVICDYKMKGINGLEFIEKISKTHTGIITMLLTGQADLNIALKAINESLLYKYILKPWNNNELRIIIKRALEHSEIIAENKKLLNEIKKKDKLLNELEGNNPGLLSIKRDRSGNIILE